MQPRQAKVVKRPPTFHRICRYDPTADATKAQHSVKYTCKNEIPQGNRTIIQHFDKHGETELFKSAWESPLSKKEDSKRNQKSQAPQTLVVMH